MPTIVIEALDDMDQPVTDATLTIDGVVVTGLLDGKAIPLDPGAHLIAIQRNRLVRTAPVPVTVTETIVASEGVKARLVRVRLPGGFDPNMLARTIEGHTVLPWAVVSIGAITLAIGVAYIVTTPALPPNCSEDTGTCKPRAGQTRVMKADRDRAGEHRVQPVLGGMITGAGAILVVSGLLWHFLETPRPRNARLGPWVGPGTAGLGASGSF